MLSVCDDGENQWLLNMGLGIFEEGQTFLSEGRMVASHTAQWNKGEVNIIHCSNK